MQIRNMQIRKPVIRCVVGAAAVLTMRAVAADEPVYNEWIRPASAEALASIPSNWSLGHSPLPNETVRLTPMHCRNIIWDEKASHVIAGWHQEAGYIAVATINTTPKPGGFNTLRVSGNFMVGAGAVTHPRNSAAEDYWLSLDVGGDFNVSGGAYVSVSGKGFAPGAGPSPSVVPGAGASHGGQGAPHATRVSERRALTYGSVLDPVSSGSGGTVAESSTNAYHGGGAIIVKVGGRASIGGVVAANGDSRNFEDDNVGGAAGGSVNIVAETSLVVTGWVQANGGNAPGADAGGGGGGRISLIAKNGPAHLARHQLVAYGGIGASKAPSNANADRHLRAAAGTVYWAQNDAKLPRSGEVIVRDWHKTGLATTRVPSDIGAKSGELRDAQITLENNGFMFLSQSASIRALSFSSGGNLDLNGNTLITGSVSNSKYRTPLPATGTAYVSPSEPHLDTVIFNGGRLRISPYFKPIF